MAASIAVVVIDCNDSAPVAAFWKGALGYIETARDGDWVKLCDPAGIGPALAIDPVPEGKVVTNRVHLDLRPSGSVEAEVARLDGLGARTVRVFPGSHVVMHDPEGNEFCVVGPMTLASEMKPDDWLELSAIERLQRDRLGLGERHLLAAFPRGCEGFRW